MRHTNHSFRFLICTLIIAAGPLLGGVRMQVRDGRPIVDGVYVNGHGPYLFLIDAGPNVNLIETGLARKIGMSATFQVDFASTAGMTQLQGNDSGEVALDSVKANEQKCLFSDLDDIHSLSPDVQGVLGQWFLSGFDYMLDLQGKRLEFGKQDGNGTRARLTMPNGRMAVSTSLGDLVLDSGADRLILFGVEPDESYGGKSFTQTLTGAQRVGMASRRLIVEAGPPGMGTPS